MEGGELQVLRGAQRTLARWRPVVIFEHGLGASEHYGTTPEAVCAVLAEAGLAVYTLSGYLGGEPSLGADGLAHHFPARSEYYFLAAPAPLQVLRQHR